MFSCLPINPPSLVTFYSIIIIVLVLLILRYTTIPLPGFPPVRYSCLPYGIIFSISVISHHFTMFFWCFFFIQTFCRCLILLFNSFSNHPPSPLSSVFPIYPDERHYNLYKFIRCLYFSDCIFPVLLLYPQCCYLRFLCV